MRFMPSSIFYYLASRVDPEATDTTGNMDGDRAYGEIRDILDTKEGNKCADAN